ncbi:MAG: MFS transporter [Kiritimatiellaeota bacterium]|nr:MFS transporter [Kiritimatiellota bacterium]
MQPANATRPPSFERRLYLLSAMFFFIFAGAGAQQAYLVQYLSAVAGWDRVACSLVITTLYCTMVVFRVANLAIFRTWSDKAFTVVGSLTYLLFTLVMAGLSQRPVYAVALGAAVVWGIGAAMMWTGTTMQVLRLSDEAGGRHGTGMGVLYGSTQAGWLTGAVVLGLVYAALSRERLYALYLAAAGITLIGNALAFLLPASDASLARAPTGREVGTVLGRPRVQVAGTLQFLSALAYGVILGAFGRFVEQTCGSRWVWVTIALYPGTRVVFSLLGGGLADRMGQARVLVGGFLCGAVGMAVLALWHGPAAAVIAGICLGLLNSTVPVVASAMVGDVPRQKRRLVYGVLFGFRDLGVAAAAVGVNLLGLKLQMTGAFGAGALVFVFCAWLATRLERVSARLS